MLIVSFQETFFNCLIQQIIVIAPAEALEEAKRHAKFLDFAENFDALHSDGEKSQILSILIA